MSRPRSMNNYSNLIAAGRRNMLLYTIFRVNLTVIIGSVLGLYNTWTMKIFKYYKSDKYFLESLPNVLLVGEGTQPQLYVKFFITRYSWLPYLCTFGGGNAIGHMVQSRSINHWLGRSWGTSVLVSWIGIGWYVKNSNLRAQNNF